MPFQLDGVSFQRLGDRELFRELAVKARIPEAVEVGRIELMTHGLYDVRPCHRPCMGEALLKQPYTEKMIAMAMGQVNRGQILAARHNSVRQSLRSFGGKEGIDQHSIPFTVDQRGRVGHPGQGLVAWRQLPVEAGPLGDEHGPLQESVFMVHENSSASFCNKFGLVRPPYYGKSEDRRGRFLDVHAISIVWLVMIGDFRSGGDFPSVARQPPAPRPPRRAAPTRRFGKLSPGINMKRGGATGQEQEAR